MKNTFGIELFPSSRNNIISGNNIMNNEYGIELDYSNNIVFHNNFVNNTYQASCSSPAPINIWDDGYPSGGNYWSDYKGVDEKSGPHQDQPGSDGIGDTPYVICEGNMDRYPLMKPWTSAPVTTPSPTTTTPPPTSSNIPGATTSSTTTAQTSASPPTSITSPLTSSNIPVTTTSVTATTAQAPTSASPYNYTGIIVVGVVLAVIIVAVLFMLRRGRK
jgi:parallel beta-helix repeat protein